MLRIFHYLVIANLRRRRDLNPRAAINDLHPFQGCPFNHLGTSPKSCLRKRIQFSPTLENNSNGEGGIRTHAPLRTNGFQDRLVMTTSIPLRALRLFSDKDYFSKSFLICQHLFLSFFKLFFIQKTQIA